MICNHCDVTVGDLQLEDLEGSISCSTCTSCAAELENQKNAIDRLKTMHSEFKRNINRSQSLFIRIIPPEIIARISEFAITNFRIIGSVPDVILLSSVCSDWRRTVFGTPELWSSIKIDLPSISQTYDMASSTLPRLAIFINEWLSRSGQLPLNISLCYGHHDKKIHDPLVLGEYRPIFKILDKYSSRWHNFYISIPTVFLPLLQPCRLPLLEQLHITYKSYGRLNLDHVLTFPPTPCLNTVKIQPFLRYIGIQWDTVHKLTHLSLESITSRDCFVLLRQNPLLVHCTFHRVVDKFEDRLKSPIVSSLTYLSLHLRRERDTSRIFENIKLPCLETLVLSNVTIGPVIAFLKRSACSLHTLSLPNWQVRTHKLIQLLQFLSPTLKRLAISRNPSPIRETKNYLSLLTRIYTSQSEVVENDFLPHLEIFEYREESPLTLELSMSMLSNLPSRNYPKPATSISLRSACISASAVEKEVPGDISIILQRLEEGGILSYT